MTFKSKIPSELRLTPIACQAVWRPIGPFAYISSRSHEMCSHRQGDLESYPSYVRTATTLKEYVNVDGCASNAG